eukprot:2842171-Prorocentrum_lima.AAC.1
MVADQKAAEAAAVKRTAEQALRDGERERQLAQESSRKMQEEVEKLRLQYQQDRIDRDARAQEDRAMILSLIHI